MYSLKVVDYCLDNNIVYENIDVFSIDCPFALTCKINELLENIDSLENRYVSKNRKVCMFSIVEDTQYCTIFCSKLDEITLLKTLKLRAFW